MLKENNLYTTYSNQIVQEIVNTIRNTLDSNEINAKLVETIGKAFLIQNRCYQGIQQKMELFCQLKLNIYHRLWLKVMVENNFTKEVNIYFNNLFEKENSSIIPDIELIVEDSLFNVAAKEFFNEHDIKSNYGFPVFIENKLYGAIVLQYTQQKVILEQNEISILKVIADQTSIAIKQAELFTKIKKRQRENYF